MILRPSGGWVHPGRRFCSFGPKSRRRRFERTALMRNFLTIQEYDSEVGGGKPFYARFARRRFEGTCSADNCMICAREQPRYLPDCYAGASSVRRPMLCTANPCASPLQQQVTELPKSQGVKSCWACKVASSGLGETPMQPRTAIYKTGSGSDI